jgi:colanic acid/amylovoran biosynthesis glycosyltransferase
MTSVAYLANSFPEPVEPYVGEEIRELRRRGCEVVPCSFRRPSNIPDSLAALAAETVYVFPLRLVTCLSASFLLVRNLGRIRDLTGRGLRGPESTQRRLRTLFHTWLGAYLATVLDGKQIRHIHIHHGYFSAWAGMVAARLLNVSFSLTLHGSDLLVRADFLDCKLMECRFCITVSDFNRKYILGKYPEVDSRKIFVHHLGIDPDVWVPRPHALKRSTFSILSVGRLHAIKNYGFLILACHALRIAGVRFRCVIAGEGDQRNSLMQLARELKLEEDVSLCGYVPREKLPELYAEANAVVLTSSSEGIPVVLMEAMAMECVVLAPAITGIPELIRDGQTGFLYKPNSMEHFVEKLKYIRVNSLSMGKIGKAARRHVELHFNQRRNLAGFADDFIRYTSGIKCSGLDRKNVYEDSVLQQIQLPVQRDRSVSV